MSYMYTYLYINLHRVARSRFWGTCSVHMGQPHKTSRKQGSDPLGPPQAPHGDSKAPTSSPQDPIRVPTGPHRTPQAILIDHDLCFEKFPLLSNIVQ